MSLRWPFLALVCVAGAACLPVSRTYLLRPGGRVLVTEAQTARPLAGARVIVYRDELPHRRAVARFEGVTGQDGAAAFEREVESRTVYPLMPHGVPQHLFRVCAEAAGHASGTLYWDAPLDADRDLPLVLLEGSRPCERQLDLSDLPPGQGRLDALERQADGRWQAELTLAAGTVLAVGSVLRGTGDRTEVRLQVVELSWSVDPPEHRVRRVGVRVEAVAAPLTAGDLLRVE